MKNLENFKAEADMKGWTLIQINTDGNDYPRGLGAYGAIGFDTIKEAEQFAEDNGGEVYQFQTKKGHTFWRAKGWTNKPFTAQDYLNDCNDDVNEVCKKSEIESFFEFSKDAIENEDLEQVKNLIEKLKECIDFFDKLPETETPFYDGNSSSYGSISNTMMQYNEDVYINAIGVFFDPELHEDKYKYAIIDRESGNEIDKFETYQEAKDELENYEAQDVADNTYTPNFYEIVAL